MPHCMGVTLVAIKPYGTEAKQYLRIGIPHMHNPDLQIETGTALIDFRAGDKGDWRRETLEIELDAKWETYVQNLGNVPPPTQLSMVSLASISNDRTAVWAGWAVDRHQVAFNKLTGKSTLYVEIAVRDSDGALNRVQYTVISRGTLVNNYPAQY
jgi:hypothetical protein